MILEFLLAVLIIWYIAFHIKRRRLYKLAKKFDGPKPLPIIGNALKCLVPLSDIPDLLLRNDKFYKSPTRFWFGPYLVIYICNPEDVKTVLNSAHALNKLPYMYELLETVTGRGLVTAPVEEWKRHRRLISPNFNQFNLERCFSTFLKQSKVLVDDVKSEKDKIFDIEWHFMNCMVNIVCESLLGFNLDKNTSADVHKMFKLFSTLTGQIAHRMSNILYFFDCIYNMTPSGKMFIENKKKYNSIIKSILEKWKEVLRTEHIEDIETLKNIAPRSFVEHLLLVSDEMGKLTEEELLGEVNTIIAAALEATANMMAFLMIMLGMHQDIQDMVYHEIKGVLGSRKELQFEDLQNFSYLERVIKESLRMFPIGAGFGRYTDKEIILNEKQTIPSNTWVFIGQLILHRDPTIWPNPTRFDPDRFLLEEVSKRHPYSWIPFAAGPRTCIGFQFAMHAMKVMTFHLVQNYKITTPFKNVDDVQLTLHIVLKSTHGYKVTLTDR